MKLRILGSGTSSGVPRVGGDWGRCDPAEPRNRRRRVSIIVEAEESRILVDTSPDLREQLLDAEVDALDAVIWTHEHADHCHGIDDLRGIYYGRGTPIPGYAGARALGELTHRFTFAFDGANGYPAYVEGRSLPPDFDVGRIRVRSIELPHGPISTAALRFDHAGRSIVYSTDFNELTDEAANLFQGADVWIVDAVRRHPHPTHPHLALALEWIARMRPGFALLTHLDQSMDYRELCAELPPGVEPAYDGLEITL